MGHDARPGHRGRGPGPGCLHADPRLPSRLRGVRGEATTGVRRKLSSLSRKRAGGHYGGATMFARMFSREERTSRSRTPAPKGAAALGPSAHVDTFTRDNLPPAEQWPDLLLDRPEFQYPEYLNAAVELTDRMVEKGFGDR